MLPQQFYDTRSLRNHCDHKTHFFDASTMRFFQSRIGQNAYPCANPYKTLFVTSERFDDKSRRLYTVRLYDCRTHDIDTIGEFQEYRTARAANTAAILAALKMEYPIEDQQEYANALNEAYDSSKRRAQSRGEAKFYVSDLGHVSLLTNRHFFNTTEG